MRERTDSTEWTCDGVCGEKVTLTGGYKDLPPKGWRIIAIYPMTVNLALEPATRPDLLSLCPNCFLKVTEIIA